MTDGDDVSGDRYLAGAAMTWRTFLLSTIIAFCAVPLPVSAGDSGQNKTLEVFNSRREIDLYLPYEDRVVSFSNMETFQRHYPPDRCELSAFVNDRHKDQLTIKYECPAFYKGQPMQFKFITRMKDSAWVLLNVWTDGKLVDGPILKTFAEDHLTEGFGSYQRRIHELGSLDVSVRGQNGLQIYGQLQRIVQYWENDGYPCAVESQTSSELLLTCTFFNRAYNRYNNDDQWAFLFRNVSNKEVELQHIYGTLRKNDLNIDQIRDFVELMVRR
jgi:hypothetical protein